jgi:large subunit ribosomal protein L18
MAVKVYPKSNTAKKKVGRLKRATRTRCHIRELQERNPDLVRMSVYRSNKHISVQLIKYFPLERRSEVVAVVSSMEKAVSEQCKNTSNIEAAKLVGKLVAEKAKSLGLEHIAFDRSGFLYHGRVKALADAARENGLQF